MSRVNFSSKAKRIIALRSGYRCAHPDCEGRTTVGPARQPDQYENTGKASHIFAASKRGPRGTGNLSDEELRSPTNGVWFCGKHSDQVDKNSGRDYPPEVLLGWKAIHEVRIAREHGALLYPFGWVEELGIRSAPIFEPDQQIRFAKLNVIVGDNETGKTAIYEWLTSLKDSTGLSRWGAYPNGQGQRLTNLAFGISFFSPLRHQLAVAITPGHTTFTLDHSEVPFSPVGYEVVSLPPAHRHYDSEEGDHRFLARAFHIDEVSVQSLADFITEQPGVFLKSAGWRAEVDEETGKKHRNLVCRFGGNGTGQPFRSLSGSETGAVLLDLAIARAKVLAMHRPTLLILETSALSMTPGFLATFQVALASPEMPFQTIMVTTVLDENAEWGGWQVMRLIRHKGGLTKVTVGDVRSRPT